MGDAGAGTPDYTGWTSDRTVPNSKGAQIMGKLFKRILEWKALKALFRGGQASGRSQARRARW